MQVINFHVLKSDKKCSFGRIRSQWRNETNAGRRIVFVCRRSRKVSVNLFHTRWSGRAPMPIRRWRTLVPQHQTWYHLFHAEFHEKCEHFAESLWGKPFKINSKSFLWKICMFFTEANEPDIKYSLSYQPEISYIKKSSQFLNCCQDSFRSLFNWSLSNQRSSYDHHFTYFLSIEEFLLNWS